MQRTKHTKPWDQVDYNKLKSLEGVLWTGPQQGPSRVQRVKDYVTKVCTSFFAPIVMLLKLTECSTSG
jgi:hypothetical protein